MRRIESPRQDSLIDPFYFLGDRRKDLLREDWAVLLRNDLVYNIPVDEIKKSFHETMGRPTKELGTVLGVLISQQMFNLTDRMLSKLNFPTNKQRLDSTHIHSDMQRLNRIGLFNKTI